VAGPVGVGVGLVEDLLPPQAATRPARTRAGRMRRNFTS
jgi:hypothetical protein